MAVSSEVSAFLEDLFENLSAIEEGIAQLEDEPTNQEHLNAIFRAAHTIKGNASMMNLTNLVALGHALETTLQECLNARLQVDRDALRLFSECRVTMTEIGAELRSGKDGKSIAILETTDRLQALLLDEEGAAKAVSMDGVRRMQITLRIAKAELAPAVRAFLAETKIAEMGTIISKEPPEEKLESPEFLASNRELHFTVDTTSSPKDIRENLNIDLIEDVEIVDKGAGSAPKTVQSTARERNEMVADVQSTTSDTIRLSVQTIDRLLNLAGELVLANGGLLQLADELTTTQGAENQALRLTEKNREIFHIASEIQNIVMKSRMLPIEHVFSRFTRFVRDYAESAGKMIRLETSGEKTELDKRVIDEIVKPLTHLIRNSLDHGIETSEERIAAGKPPEGALKISAAQSGSSILITVEDDGRGLNAEKILKKAIEKNLIKAEEAQNLTPEEIREFIFMRGFSTKEAADDLSGRGFGMDIVRESIERLSGDLSIHSVDGKGTRMTINLPLTLAILSTLTFKVRNDVFALPLTVIDESLRVHDGSIVEIEGRAVLHAQDEMLPFLRLDRV
ncbi:MAG TPA: chemotaxis protein CheA, partial [Turneriella sp.]|nr:chemotaxis protein CheA [Turneriella sp.]